MLALSLWLFALTPPNLERLGAPDWHVREAEHARCDNLLLSLLLPPGHACPEIDARCRDLRTRNLRSLCPVYRERCLLLGDFAAWVREYLQPGRSRLAREWDTFVLIHTDARRADLVFAALPVPANGSQAWLRGHFVSGEYERYLEHLDYHGRVAPMPNEVARE